MEKFERIIIGAGIYGLYSALISCKMGFSVLVIEKDDVAFSRATYINQARVHQGYHYPRSLSTATKSAGYFERFNKEYGFCINKAFDQVYATSNQYSWTNAQQFVDFCKATDIFCQELHPNTFFKSDMCDGAFLTREYTYDAIILRNYFLEELQKFGANFEIKYNSFIRSIEKLQDYFQIEMMSGEKYKTDFLLNATYASTNQILDLLGFEKFKIKYELCEIILCDVNDKMKQVGITVMDGPFFSIMPFGKTGLHSLTSVTFTPHSTSYDELPKFLCQESCGGYCSENQLGNCNYCKSKPETAFPYMEKLARKYMRDELDFSYRQSLYSMKPILMNSEVDDSRPTVVKVFSKKPTFISVLSGKINTIYDLDEVLRDE